MIRQFTLTNYFELVRPEYVYVQIIPHKSIRNYNSTNIAKTIGKTYQTLNRRIHKEQHKIFFETNFKLSYVIDIKNNNASFYFIVPKPFLNILLEKIKEIWSKATVEIVNAIEKFSDSSFVYQLVYSKEDALSLMTDRKSNEPLNSILNVIEIMKDTDRVTICYNFLERSQFGWMKQYMDTIQKVKEKKPVDREKFNIQYITKITLNYMVELIDGILELLIDFTGGEKKKQNVSFAESVTSALEKMQELSPSTKKKKELNVLDTQIAVISNSNDTTRQENNALAVCQAYRVLDEDNKLIYKKVNTKIKDIEKYKFDKIEINTVSTDEVQNFIQIPGRQLLKDFHLQHIQTEETMIPDKLKSGYISLGMSMFKGIKQEAFLEDQYDVANLPLTIIGSQGSGKTKYLGNYVRYANNRKEGCLIIDFIKNCELSDSIINAIPKQDCIVIDMSKESDLQGLGFNEIKIDDTMPAYQKLKLANLQAQQTMAIVDSINDEDTPLTSKMRRYLSSSANVVYVLGNNTSIRDVINCLQDHNKRAEYINSLSDELKSYLPDEINSLIELDETDKTGKVIGTRDSKIEGILDRVNLLKEDFKLKFMFNKSTEDNINLVNLMEQGKVVIIKMPEIEFPLRYVKNVLVTYWISKIWLTSQIRGSLHDKPKRCHVITDEIFQAPQSMKLLKFILPQSRKFGCKFVFTIQYLKQIEEMEESLKASGSSYMFLKGTKETDFNTFKSNLGEYEYDDLIEMKEFSSLNLIYYSGGYAGFITKLPKPI